MSSRSRSSAAPSRARSDRPGPCRRRGSFRSAPRNRRDGSAPRRSPTAMPPPPADRRTAAPPARRRRRRCEISTVVASGSRSRLIAAFQPAWQAAANSTARKTNASMNSARKPRSYTCGMNLCSVIPSSLCSVILECSIRHPEARGDTDLALARDRQFMRKSAIADLRAARASKDNGLRCDQMERPAPQRLTREGGTERRRTRDAFRTDTAAGRWRW